MPHTTQRSQKHQEGDFDVTGEGADQHFNMNPGLNGILREGGDAADADAGYHEHERYYECLDEEHDQANDPGNTDVPEHIGYLGDRIAFECGALSACTLRLGDGFLELIKPGVINEHIVRYHYIGTP